MRFSEGRIALRKIFLFGAGARNRTRMPLRAGDFESKILKITITYQALDNWYGFPQLFKI
jgi:hypothetical protein